MARSGEETVRYGGDTACVEVRSALGDLVILDAGSGLLHATRNIEPDTSRIDLFLTHLHMDHIQGLGFFPPLRSTYIETHLWGPVGRLDLAERLKRYLSPPLFPVRLRDFENTKVRSLGPEQVKVGSLSITADLVCHPGSTLGYRIEEDDRCLVYIPDHEPALGQDSFPADPDWISGTALMEGADLLIHDAQYTTAEYEQRVGWGHSTLRQTAALAAAMGVKSLATFHHDPEHTDTMLDRLHADIVEGLESDLEVIPGTAGSTFDV